MRKLILHFIIASCTFAVGVIVNYFAQNPVITPVSVNEIPKPIELVSAEVGKTCEVHGLPLKAERIQAICGEFKGSFKGGGWGHLQVSCEHAQNPRMSLEDAQFHFNLAGGLNTLMWWEEYRAAKEAQFPHGYDWPYEECKSNGARCREVEVCTKCRTAETSWKREAVNRSGE